jgi:hypothetical protein
VCHLYLAEGCHLYIALTADRRITRILENRGALLQNYTVGGRPIMTITELEQSLSAWNQWRLLGLVVTAIVGVGFAAIQIQYYRADTQLRAARTEENLRQQVLRMTRLARWCFWHGDG